MLPNIDPTTTSATAGAVTPMRRPEFDKAVETYRLTQAVEQDVFEKTTTTRSNTDVLVKAGRPAPAKSAPGKNQQPQDTAEINFQLTREERETFVNIMSGRERFEEISEEEQRLLQKTSERIEKLVADATAKNAEHRERIENAIKEWYIRLSNGKHEPGEDLLYLIRRAARGQLKPSS